MGIFLWVLSVIIFFVLLYFVVKAAVKDAILEARDVDSKVNNKVAEDNISQITCGGCGKSFDVDYQKCPYCGKLQ